MVARAGQPSGWPVSIEAGTANPVRATTHEICSSGGGDNRYSMEVALMATILTPSHPQFVFVFAAVRRADRQPRICMLRTVAGDEHAARLSQTDILIKTDKNVDFVRIVPRLDFFVIEIGYTVPLPAPSATTGKGTSSIDLGLGNLLTVTSNVMQPIIISGKTVTHINKYSNWLLTQVQTKTVKSSHLTKAIYRKRRNKLKDYFHKTSRFLVDTWVNNNIENVVVGYNINWKFENKIQNFSKVAYRAGSSLEKKAAHCSALCLTASIVLLSDLA